MSRRTPSLLAFLIVAIGVLRIAATYTTFSETNDEIMHLTAGLELYQEHRYTLQIVNPPLPRVVIAFVPYLAGVAFDASAPPIERLRRTFYTTGRYKTTLVEARVGTLVFFIIGAVSMWLWGRRELGDLGGILALLLLTTQPSFLGHSGLATHDAAATSGVALSLLAFSRWLERPTAGRAAALGAAAAFAFLCKFSCILFVPLACAAIFGVRLFFDADVRANWWRSTTLFASVVVAALFVWACYGFSVGKVGTIAVPAPKLVLGIVQVGHYDREGFLTYFMGRSSLRGWKLYFPVALALKTTIGFLLLLLVGPFFFARRESTAWRVYLEAIAASAAIMAPAIPSALDLGIRYILPIYVPLSLGGAAAAMAMLRDSRLVSRVVACLFVGWHIVASTIAHPDYLAYFNEIAGRDPSRYLIDSNLDWGQDVLRLRDTVRRLHVNNLGVSLMGPADLKALGFPPHYDANPWVPTRGWIAVSDHSYRMTLTKGGWFWLDNRPYHRVGKSIRLYWIE